MTTNSQTLRVLQTLSRIGKIVTSVLYIVSIVGFCACLFGFIGLTAGSESFKIGGVTFESMLRVEKSISREGIFALLVSTALYCLKNTVLFRFARQYFDTELCDGTPFRRRSSEMLLKLGISVAAVSLGTQILSEILCSILAKGENISIPDFASSSDAVVLGVMLAVLALVCRYGAEREGDGKSENKEPSERT